MFGATVAALGITAAVVGAGWLQLRCVLCAVFDLI